MRHDRDHVHDHGKQIKFEVLTITHKVEILQTIWGHYRYTYIYVYIFDILLRSSRSHLDTLRWKLVLLGPVARHQRRCLGSPRTWYKNSKKHERMVYNKKNETKIKTRSYKNLIGKCCQLSDDDDNDRNDKNDNNWATSGPRKHIYHHLSPV